MQSVADDVDRTAVRAGWREWLGLATLAVPCALYAADLTVLYLAIPEISRQLRPSASELLWIVDIYGFMVAGWLVTMGALGDRWGRRRLLIIGAAAFAVTSAIAAYSTSAEMLIGARALQGIAAATLAPSTLALIRNMFRDDRQRATAIGLWVASFSAGSALGPVFGGWLLESFWWGSVLLINVPFMLILIACAPWLLPEYRDETSTTLDLASVGLSLSGVLLIMFALKRTAESGVSLLLVACGLVGFALALVFVRRQGRIADPMIDLKLFSNERLATALTVNLLGLFTLLGIFLLIVQYLQLVLGMGPLEAGLWTAPSGLIFVIGSLAAPTLVRIAPAGTVMAIGFLIATAGFAALAVVDAQSSHLWVIGALLIICVGVSPIGTITTDIVLTAAPPERAGAASAVSETSFEFGGAAGIAVLGSITTAIYHMRIEALAPDGLSFETMAAARDTLGGAVDAAAKLEAASVSQALLLAARQAFSDGLSGAAMISAFGTLAAAVLAYRSLSARS